VNRKNRLQTRWTASTASALVLLPVRSGPTWSRSTVREPTTIRAEMATTIRKTGERT
jgi:hypothetical protein